MSDPERILKGQKERKGNSLDNTHRGAQSQKNRVKQREVWEARRSGRLRSFGWLMVLGGLLTMSGGLFLEQTSPPTISSLGLILALAGIVVLARDVKSDSTGEEQ